MEKQREEKVKFHRILEIDNEIRSSSFPNGTSLAKQFEVSRATIMRDIEFLRDRYDAPLEFNQQKNGYYYSDPTFFVQSVMLTEGELFTVSTIMPLLEQYRNTPLEDSFKKIMNKITELMPDKVSIDSYFVSNDIEFIPDPLPQIEPEVFETIFKAVKLNQTIHFDYRSISKQDYSSRDFDPYHVICQKGNWYICGFCHKNNDIRVYAFSRIKNIKLLESNFAISEDFDLNDHIDSSFGIWNSKEAPVKIELLFTKEINTYVLERTWHKTQKIEQKSDGSVYLTFMTNQLQETLHWVLNFGGNVKVLNPPELAQMVLEEAKNILKQY